MSERALRGTRLGATSYETDSGIDLAPRQDVEYACPSGHRFRMPFSVEAEVPMVWECRVCGAQALRVGGVAEEDKPVKPARTHWDMLLERRSIPELEEVLAERLEVLRGGGIGGGLGSRARRTPPVNLATGAPEPEGGTAPKNGKAGPAAGAAGDQPTGGHGAAKDGHPASGHAAGAQAKTSAPNAGTSTTSTATKKAPAAKKTAARTAPAKKTAASSKAAPATKTTDKPAKKTAAKKPSAK